MTQRFQLLGDPVCHSVSPQIHTAAFESWGIDAVYESLVVSVDGLESALADESLCGGNVTVPHKLKAAELLQGAGPEVRATGACNCFWREMGILTGANTDVGGFRRALGDMELDFGGARVLLLGAGGAARAAVYGLIGLGVARVDIQNRTSTHAHALAQAFGPRVVPLDAPATGPYDLVVNATKLGLREDDPLPVDLGTLSCAAVFDLVYAPGRTSWVRRAEACGIPARDGLSMLVHQAALSLECWFPGRTPPLARMREAALLALGRRASEPS